MLRVLQARADRLLDVSISVLLSFAVTFRNGDDQNGTWKLLEVGQR